MIIVTGNGRTGTSLAMQTLKLLGLPVAGHKFLQEFGDKTFNPKGFYDLPCNETANGIPIKYKDNVVKANLIALENTDKTLIEKVFFCVRNIEDVVKSQKKVLGEFAEEINADENTLREAFHYTNNRIREYVTGLPFMYINYSRMINDTNNAISEIANFLDCKSDLKNAILNVERN